MAKGSLLGDKTVLKYLLLFIFMTMTRLISKAEPFELEGEITYSTSRGEYYSNAKNYSLIRNGEMWKIRTSGNSSAESEVSSVLFDEAGCDGTNVFLLQQNDINKAALLTGDPQFKSKSPATGLGRVLPSTILPCLDNNLIFPLWLAYCAEGYLSDSNQSTLVAPFFAEEDTMVGRPPEPIRLGAHWELNSSGFATNIEWYSDGTTRAMDSSGKITNIGYPPPYDHGFLQARYEVAEFAEHNGIILPKMFVLTVFGPKGEGGLTNTDLDVLYKIESRVKAIRNTKESNFVPLITEKTLIVDARINPEKDPVAYTSVSNWQTIPEIKAALQRRFQSSS